jgi:multidrug resistance efflux pump
MDRLPPIPTPAGQRWREFRVGVVPMVAFAATAAAVLVLWQQNVAAPNLVGEVEPIQSSVSSPKAGKLSQLNVTRLQRVKAGDIIAQIITTDPQILQSSLAVIQAEIQLLRMNLEPVLGQQRFALTFDRLRLDWMEQRVQLVTSRVRLELADADYRRAQELFRDKIVSQQVLDQARTTKQSLQVEVEERGKLVAEQEDKLKTLGLTDNGSAFPKEAKPEDVMQASLKVQEEKLRLTEAELSPITLVVPIDGSVSAIHHRSGEAVVAGEPIVTLVASSSDHIVGYLRQPFAFELKVGMQVEVRPRSSSRCVGHAQIIEIGAHMENVSTALAIAGNHTHDVGVPVLVSLPPTQKLLPGELVDLRILPSKLGADASAREDSVVR